MGMIMEEVGKKIHIYRKARGMTLQDLAERIHKSVSTVSKYEKGEIAVDVETLYEIAEALNIHGEQLLWNRQDKSEMAEGKETPSFFRGLSKFYGYIYDGRSNSLIRCIFDILEGGITENRYRIRMYMNFNDFDAYQNCENTYWGYIEHHDAVTNIQLTNQDSAIERASLQILASYLDSETKWALFNGFSTRPMMPIAAKMLLSKNVLKEDAQLLQMLRISKDDLRLTKLYNMFPVL